MSHDDDEGPLLVLLRVSVRGILSGYRDGRWGLFFSGRWVLGLTLPFTESQSSGVHAVGPRPSRARQSTVPTADTLARAFGMDTGTKGEALRS